jgi:hypothetical protein
MGFLNLYEPRRKIAPATQPAVRDVDDQSRRETYLRFAT